MKEKIKMNIYIYWGLTLFISIGAAILLFFFLLRLDVLISFVLKVLKILLPVFLGLLIAYILNPLVKYLENNCFNKLGKKFGLIGNRAKKFQRGISIFVTYFVMSITVFFLIKFVVPSLLESIEMMMTNIPIYINNIYEFLKDILKNNPDLAKLVDNLNTDVNNYMTNIGPSFDILMSNLTSGITNIISGLINLIIGLIVSVYLLYDKESFISNTKKVLYALLPKKVYNDLMLTLGYTDKVFGGFMIAKIIDSLIIGILTFVILSLFQIPYALIISIIVGVTNIIPYFGPFIGAIPCAFLLLMIEPTLCIKFLILIFLIQQFDGNILGPKLIGNKTGIKSFWVLFSILVFGGLFGFVGMIFGVPIFAVICSIFMRYIDKSLDKKTSK